MISLAWYWFVLLLLGPMFAGFQIGSIVEYKKGYNFADLELDLLRSLEAKAASESRAVTAEEKAVIAKIAAGARRLEFWRRS